MSRTRLLLPVIIVLAVSIAAFAIPGRPAHAGNASFVDAAGTCSGQTPCFTTIQAAVESSPNAPNFISILSGTYNESVDLDAATFEVTLRAVDTDIAYAPGTVTIAGTHPLRGIDRTSPTTISGIVFQSSVGDCVLLRSVQSDITIEDSAANECGDGTDVDGTGDDGFDLHTAVTGDVSLVNVEANGNSGLYADGIQVTAGGDVELTNTTTNNNTGGEDADGVDIYESKGDVTLTNVTANGNSEDGIYVETVASVSLTSVTANENGHGPTEGDGAFVLASGVQASSLTANDNGDDGLDVPFADNVTVGDSTLTGNVEQGGDLSGGTIQVSQTVASGNLEGGLGLFPLSQLTVDQVTVQENGTSSLTAGIADGWGILIEPALLTLTGRGAQGGAPTMSITNSLVSGNASVGIVLFNLAAQGHLIKESIICDNQNGGLRLYSPMAVDAQGNYWGSLDGPEEAGNPGGTGDEIAGGTVDYDPWLSEASTALDPTSPVAGQPAQGLVGFTDESHVYSFSEGPGSDTTFPFEIATTNGTVATDGQGPAASVTGRFEGNVMGFVWTPAFQGISEVNVSGPCGPEITIPAQVAPPVGVTVAWGDNNCSGAADPIDSLLELRFDGGLPTDTGDCPEMGAPVLVSEGALPAGGLPALPWGDVDCSGAANPVDSLKLLRFDAGLSVAQEPECPLVGSSVSVSDLPPP